jgi:membrane protein DedA with SNARE-associated domain
MIMPAHPMARWSAGVTLVAGSIILPFLVFGERLEFWSVEAMAGTQAGIAATGFVLLVADVLLPVPSSFVLTALGTALGFLPGIAVGALGMTAGCCLAYALGNWLGPDRAGAFITPAERARLSRLLDRNGLLMLAACRAVPVLAEASILVAGILRLPRRRVLAVTTCANIGVSGCYVLLGAGVSDGASFALAFASAMALSALAMVAARRFGSVVPDLRSVPGPATLRTEDARDH